MMTQFAPILIGPLSAVRTAPKPIELFGPIVTSPQTTAVGATRADGWMRGATPLWSRSIIASYSSHRSPQAARPAGLAVPRISAYLVARHAVQSAPGLAALQLQFPP